MQTSVLLAGGFCALLLAAAAPSAAAPAASGAAAELARLGADSTVRRTLALADLGVTAPIVLKGQDNARVLYFPVPAGIALAGATLRLHADYLQPEAADTRLVLSLDNDIVSARALAQERGDAGIELGVDGTARPNGLIQLGLHWTSAALGARCPGAIASGNALRIRPATALSYSYDGAAVRTLGLAWGALPPAPVILVGGGPLPAASYDSAWRIGLALARAGRHPIVRAVPRVGEAVDLDGGAVPPALHAIPAFAALAQPGRHVLADPAEVGALLALGAAGGLHADLLLSDAPLQAGIDAALQALRAQAASAGLGDAYAAWEQRNGQALGPAAAQELRLGMLAGRPVIVVGSDAGARAAREFGHAYSAAAAPSAAPVPAWIDRGEARVALPVAQLGGAPGSFEAGQRGEWPLAFALAGPPAGRTPVRAVIDVAAAPAARAGAPTVSVLLNDILLGSMRLAADGTPQRLSVDIPRYVPLAANTLRVVFQRPRGADGCDTERAPVTVLPTSHLVFERVAPADDFVSMKVRFAQGASLLVPPGYLERAAASLPTVIAVAGALNVSPANASLRVAGPGAATAGAPFLAFEEPPPAAAPLPDGARLWQASHGPAQPLPAAHSTLALLAVRRAGPTPGVVFRSLGAQGPQQGAQLLLGHGSAALLGSGGVLAEFDPDGAAITRLAGDGPSDWWRHALWWMVPLAAALAFVALLVAASHVRRRKERAAAQAKDS